jgi:hypothetical protein
MLAIVLTYLPSLLCGFHVVRTGREMFWLWIFVIAPLLGPAIYVAAVFGPELFGGRTARKLGQAARQALDPEREYREAKEALDDTPTVGNRMRLAAAAMALGRPNEAEPLYRQAATGHWAQDPALLLGHANALLELSRFEETLARLDELRALGEAQDTPPVALAYARALEGLGRYDEADEPYRFAADRMPGLEAAARYVACMAKAGRKDDARIGLTEIDRRLPKIPSHFRAEARKWRAFAASAVG